MTYSQVSIKRANSLNTIRMVLSELARLISGVFSTGVMGAMAPLILRKRLIAPAMEKIPPCLLLYYSQVSIKQANSLNTYGMVLSELARLIET